MNALVQLSTPAPELIMHSVIAHAAHYELGGGHDLARWVVEYPTQPTAEQLTALGVPATAGYHTGYVHLGCSYWIYIEKRPMGPGSCAECGAAASAALFARRGLS